MQSQPPLIGCTTYRKTVSQKESIDVYGLMPAYIEAISAAGGLPLLIPLGLAEEDLLAILDRVDGILLPGGGDVEPHHYDGQYHTTMWGLNPARDKTELFLARAAVTQHKPLLAICRGIQVLNVALGGTLWEDVGSLMPEAIRHRYNKTPRNHLAHAVSVRLDSNLSRCTRKSELWVNSLHHQAIRDLAPELVVTGSAPDGLIEAAEAPGHPFALGVQWHPENLIQEDPSMLGLFEGLVKAAAIKVEPVT